MFESLTYDVIIIGGASAGLTLSCIPAVRVLTL